MKNGPLAQLVEHLTLNQGVQGSSPWRSTISTVFADIEPWGRCFFCVFRHGKSGVSEIISFPHLSACLGVICNFWCL